MAAELKLVQPQLKVTMVHSRDKLLSSEPLPEEVKDRALELLREAGVEVRMSTRLEGTEEMEDEEGKPCTRVTFANGETMLADRVVMAISRSVPSTKGYLPSTVLDEEGYVRIHAKYVHPSEGPEVN
jgi:pyruvate/2-oxoglutarate dehydrogenase complex dihydrolipoamide dehydrogenase (E3) component